MIDDVARLLRAAGLPVLEVSLGGAPKPGWLELNVDEALVTVEPRPHYCDRGRYIVKVFPRGELALPLDSQDGFPRYYFGDEACAGEIVEWMQARKILPGVRERVARQLDEPWDDPARTGARVAREEHGSWIATFMDGPCASHDHDRVFMVGPPCLDLWLMPHPSLVNEWMLVGYTGGGLDPGTPWPGQVHYALHHIVDGMGAEGEAICYYRLVSDG